jgi:polysaccharide export outer membrane protein
MKYKYLAAISLLVTSIFISGCGSKNNEYVLFENEKGKVVNPELATQRVASSYEDAYEHKLMPNNRVSILVFNHPELSTRDVRSMVAPADERGALIIKDGTINIPLVGVVRISGLTEREASDLLSREYSRYIKNAHVTLEVLNKRVYVMGEVVAPGRVNIIENSTNLLEIISSSGGLTDFAARNEVKIIRGTESNPIVKTVDLTKISSLGAGSLTLYPNDVVYVKPNRLKQRNLAIAEAMPAINIVQAVLGALFTGKQLTNTQIFNVGEFTGYQQ